MSDRNTIVDLIRLIGDDPNREGLAATPDRVIRAYKELFAGYGQNPVGILDTTFDAGSCDQMVIVRGITFTSFCEHHLLPFEGVAHVGYLPKDRVVGLSKIPRVVQVFAKRLQIQERLTNQIADAIYDVLDPRGVGVIIDARHSCMSIRGANQPHASMNTTALRGDFLIADMKQEFYSMVGKL